MYKFIYNIICLFSLTFSFIPLSSNAVEYVYDSDQNIVTYIPTPEVKSEFIKYKTSSEVLGGVLRISMSYSSASLTNDMNEIQRKFPGAKVTRISAKATDDYSVYIIPLKKRLKLTTYSDPSGPKIYRDLFLNKQEADDIELSFSSNTNILEVEGQSTSSANKTKIIEFVNISSKICDMFGNSIQLKDVIDNYAHFKKLTLEIDINNEQNRPQITAEIFSKCLVPTVNLQTNSFEDLLKLNMNKTQLLNIVVIIKKQINEPLIIKHKIKSEIKLVGGIQ